MAKDLLLQYKEILQEKKYTDNVIQYFLDLLRQYLSDSKEKLSLSQYNCIPKQQYIEYDKLNPIDKETGQNAENQCIILKLNGGLGTSMHCRGPKSLINIKDKYCFLDLIFEQIKSSELYLMNSPATDHATKEFIQNHHPNSKCKHILQHQFPRIQKNTNTALNLANKSDNLYPPGHGDLFSVLEETKLIEKWIQEGKQYLFVSNSDNIGATFDPYILGHLINSDCPFLMETTLKTASDIKGGILAYKDKKIKLIEIAQIESQDNPLFFDITKFPIFNTNSIWIHLPTLKDKLDQKAVQLDLIENNKTIQGVECIQLETAMGSAIQSFENSQLMVVPRSRFQPVKSTSDLLKIRSDYIQIQEGMPSINPDRQNKDQIPNIKLSKEFKRLEDFENRFQAIPSLKNVNDLNLFGNIVCSKPIHCIGNVSITNTSSDPFDLAAQINYQDCQIKI